MENFSRKHKSVFFIGLGLFLFNFTSWWLVQNSFQMSGQILEIQKSKNEINQPKNLYERRKLLLEEKCENYKKYQPLYLKTVNYFYLHRSIKVLNDDLNSRDKPLITACIPPKTGTTNWQIFLYSILKGKTIKEATELKNLLKDKVYQTLPRMIYNGMDDSNMALNSSDETVELYHNSQNFLQMQSSRPLLYLSLLQDKIKERNDTISIINVRHPFSRLISAWRSKFSIYKTTNSSIKFDIQDPETWTNPVTNQFKNEILDCMDYDKSQNRQPERHKFCTFSSFVEMLVDHILTKDLYTRGRINEHFLPITYYCSPCDVDYDVVSKSETSDEDSRYFLNKIIQTMNQKNSEIETKHLKWQPPKSPTNSRQKYIDNLKNLKLPNKYTSTLLPDSSDFVNSLLEYFKNVPSKYIYLLYQQFYWDFELFGYEIQPFLEI